MSFQHFRLGDPLQQSSPSVSLYQSTIQPSSSSRNKQPYGSGDSDDGYTLVFSNLAAFQEWRAAEEERQMVEFVKGDTHGSKAVPPRFKDHTKLVCARHSRSGRKKYVKKFPDRVRKVPSRKLDGVGCPASISYKTYYDTEEVRACYASQHSHPTGPANLPFTRRGRKAVAVQDKERNRLGTAHGSIDDSPTLATAQPLDTETATPIAPPATVQRESSAPPPPPPPPTTTTAFASPVVQMTPSGQNTFQPPPNPFVYQATIPAQGFVPPPNLSHDRWENMATLFHSVRENARTFEYPSVSIAALESILIRLYLESPLSFAPQPSMNAVMQHIAVQSRIPEPRGDGGGPRNNEGTGG